MAAFAYKAIDPQGRATKGIIEAPSAAGARQMLRARTLLPLSVEPTRGKARSQAKASVPTVPDAAPAAGGLRIGRGGPRVGIRALTLLTRQLATLLGSGVRVEDALRTLAGQGGAQGGSGGARTGDGRSPAVTSLLLNLRASVLDGQSLARAMDDYPSVFDTFYRASVRAGETAGRLGEVMEHLAAHVEAQSRNRQKVQLALLYPALLALVSLGVIIALLTFVVPDIVRVFTSRGAELPFLTRALIAVSDALSSYGLVAGGVIVGTGLLAVQLYSRPAVRLRVHRAFATGALTRRFSMRVNAAQFSGTLATLTVSSVPLVEALRAAAQTVPNLHIRGLVAGVVTRVQDGAPLSVAMEEAKVFPPMLLAMVSSGEKSGRLAQSLSRAADDQHRELDALVSALVGLVEPAVLLLMGGVVMILVLAILMPIVDLNNLVG